MELLMGRLTELRKGHDADEWEALFQTEAIGHPITRLIFQDPFTDHSFRKPRGYPGDAALLDFIYGFTPMPPGTSAMGTAVFEFNRERQAPRSVRSRAEILAREIDETAAQTESPRILSIACGHLREAGLSKAVMEGRIGEFIALDQDPLSLAEVERAYASRGVRTVQESVRAILAGKARFTGLNLVYAAGLYDYLSERVAARLTRLMFDMLAPGGRLLIANFAPCLNDIGYIESYMGWKLIYREPQEMIALARDIASSEWKSHRLFWDEHESIVFLEIIKRRQINVPVTLSPGLKGVVVPGLNNLTIAPGIVTGWQRGRTRSRGKGHGKANGDGGSNGAAVA